MTGCDRAPQIPFSAIEATPHEKSLRMPDVLLGEFSATPNSLTCLSNRSVSEGSSLCLSNAPGMQRLEPSLTPLSDWSFSFRGPQTNRLVGKIMVSFDHSHRPAPGAHEDGVSDRGVSSDAHATQKR